MYQHCKQQRRKVHAVLWEQQGSEVCAAGAADEVDALLGRRRDHEHEAVTSMKTEFMQLWDGFMTESRANVMVLAATNRPYDLDEAVLRRRGLSITQAATEPAQGGWARQLGHCDAAWRRRPAPDTPYTRCSSKVF